MAQRQSAELCVLKGLYDEKDGLKGCARVVLAHHLDREQLSIAQSDKKQQIYSRKMFVFRKDARHLKLYQRYNYITSGFQVYFFIGLIILLDLITTDYLIKWNP